jgi:hypothetical protein
MSLKRIKLDDSDDDDNKETSEDDENITKLVTFNRNSFIENDGYKQNQVDGYNELVRDNLVELKAKKQRLENDILKKLKVKDELKQKFNNIKENKNIYEYFNSLTESIEENERKIYEIDLEIKKIERKLKFNSTYYPYKGNKFEIDNGLIGMKRDINLKLSAYLKKDNDIRHLFGVSSDYVPWKRHFLFTKFHYEPQIVSHKNLKRLSHHTFQAEYSKTILRLKNKMPIDSGIYIFRVKIVDPHSNALSFNFDSAHENEVTEITVFQPTFVGWYLNDLLIFKIDTDSRTISYLISRNNNVRVEFIHEYNYTNKNPLEISIKMYKGEIVHLDYFGKIENI